MSESESESVEFVDETGVKVDGNKESDPIVDETQDDETQERVKRPRKSQKRAPCWQQFEVEPLKKGMKKEEEKAKCKHCGSKYLCHGRRYGISNLKNHLEKCKPYLAKIGDGQTKITFEHGDTSKMMAWKFDQKESRKALAHMIVVDELPFSFVEGEGFRHYNRVNQPLFQVPSRGTVTTECFSLYLDEKKKLRELIRRNIGRVCLTTDTWTSNKKTSFMALTAHFVDNNWDLKKKVLNFSHIDGHRGVDIGKGIESCLNEWEIDNILTISVDNASANDVAIDFLKSIFANNHNCLLQGKWMHIRCAAHVLNLVVQDGLKKIDKSIENIRCVVKWVKNSGARIDTFMKCAEIAKCESTKHLVLDVATRWNSTYEMLEVAQAYEQAFYRYMAEDVNFKNEIRKMGHEIPTKEDWIKGRKLCEFLKEFDDVTNNFSGTKYVTSHTLVVHLAKIRNILREQLECDLLGQQPADQLLYDIAKVMKPKFDKYFGEIDNMNLLSYFALLLDPRNKEEFLEIIVDDHYGLEGKAIVELKKTHIKNEFQALYEDNVRIHAPPSTTSSTSRLGKRSNGNNPPSSTTNPDHVDRLRNKMKTSQKSSSPISELDKYFGESVEDFKSNDRFDILLWWKVNSPRFPILSHMAKDLFAIPISTVASESVFSTSGRVLDSFRSSLGDKTIESLICIQDWLRKSVNPEKEEDLEAMVQLEKDLSELELTRLV